MTRGASIRQTYPQRIACMEASISAPAVGAMVDVSGALVHIECEHRLSGGDVICAILNSGWPFDRLQSGAYASKRFDRESQASNARH